MTDSAPDQQASEGPSAAVATCAESWTEALLASARVPMARPAIRTHLADDVQRLLEILAAPEFRPDGAAEVGEWLVSARFTGPTSLRCSIEVLGAALADAPPERVAAVLGAVAAGYAHGVRRQALAEQEDVRAALARARQDLHDSEARFRRLFTSSAAGIAIFDLDGGVVEANPALVRMLGHAEGNAGPDPDELFEPGDLAALRSAWASGDEARTELRFTGPLGDPMWTTVALSLVRDADGRPKCRIAVIEDVTEQRMLRDYLRHQALHDVLTGLPNRQSFLPKLEGALSQPGSITLCYLDVDSVAIVNDGIGYEAGDELLRVVARRLTAVVAGENATVARIGGDEFVVLIEDSPATPSISALAEAIDTELSEPVYLSGHGVGVSAGMGFVRTTAQGLDAMSLLRQAHSTLRRAESGGKGQWGIYDAGQDARDRTRLSLIATMPRALENGEIAIDYRPVIRVGEPPHGDEQHSGEQHGGEQQRDEQHGEQVAVAARLRWDEAEFGVVGHEECLDFADTLGLSGHLGAWLLEEACSFAAAEELPVIVRLSADQSRDPDLAAVVAEAVRTSGLAPDRLWLSLDAACLASWSEALEDNLTTLADMGVRRLLHGFTCGLRELALVRRHALHGVELDEPPDEPLAREALAMLVPMLRSAGALVISGTPGADLAVRW
ncbi:diguanylate cyclase domain-containing protein [Actinosynnema sp. CS-041913]|uniref:diguanylate cyclase domain-containing protein n=1 Tax=Actinosynnema sp. CS-041913 TaxID=3239917 RepID=UPI003D926797